MDERVRQQVEALPDQPGIYVFLGTNGQALYVGKAKSLRKRVANYAGRDLEPRLATMVAEAVDLTFLVTGSEAEALLAENNWIKQSKPRYNVLLRDDKTYPYLKLTREPWPRLAFTRRIRDDGADYFGPYLPGGLARRAIKLVQKLFGVRVCRLEIDGSLPRPCLYHGMHRCLGPCVAALTTAGEYARAVEEARLFLSGRTEKLVRALRADMETAAEQLDFERAARLRDLTREIEGQRQRRSLSSVEEEDADIYGVVVHGRQAAVAILVMRGGQVLDRRELFWDGEQPLDRAALLAELLPQIYDRTTFIPEEIHLPVAVEGDEALAEWLGGKKGERVILRYPARGPRAERLQLAEKNAEFAFRRRFRSAAGESPGAEALARTLDLAEAPRRIEGFDISNLQGSEVVASMVVWDEGRMRKSDYRSFNIRNLAGQDDFASIGQAVERRYRRQLDETGILPDLVLIDGGRGQLNAALAAFARVGLEDVPVVALAKRDEEVYLPAAPEPLRLDRHDPGLQLLQAIRDEAHRFAVSRHRTRRSSRSLRGLLDEVPGIGPVRRRALLRQFGSLDALRVAPAESIAAVIGPAAAARLAAALAAPPDVN
ncbi:MAG: excinuclease ABC subunit UvrC [Thermoanaerobaculia bacterium]